MPIQAVQMQVMSPSPATSQTAMAAAMATFAIAMLTKTSVASMAELAKRAKLAMSVFLVAAQLQRSHAILILVAAAVTERSAWKAM